MKKVVLLSVTLLVPIVVSAQNFEYSPVQAAFENESFFYRPGQLSPSNFGAFSQLVPGFITSNPLNQLAQNPAWLPELNGHDLYAYVNVQSRNTYKSYGNPAYYNPCPYCEYVNSSVPGNNYIVPVPDAYNAYNTANGHRLNQEPFLSASVIGYPFADKRIFAGFSYQAIISSEDYYAYPGFTYPQGSAFSNSVSGAVSSVDNFQKNHLKQTGHFLAFYGGYKVSERALLGLRIGATFFQRSGGYGNQTHHAPPYGVFYETVSDPAVNPANLLTEQRSQYYRHMAFDLGGRYIFSQKLTGMAHLGYLAGSGDEMSNTITPIYYETGTANSGTYYQMRKSVTSNILSWNNHGHALNGGLSLQFDVSPYSQLRFFYETYTNRTKLIPGARSQSYSNVISQNTGTVINSSQSTMLHSGNGSEYDWNHQIGLFYTLFPSSIITLDFGLQYEHGSRNTHTLESSDITGLLITQSIDTTGVASTSRQPVNNNVQINWRNHVREHSFQIPLIAHVRLFNRFEVWGGFNEQIASIKKKDNLVNPNPEPHPTYYVQSLSGSTTYTIGEPAFYMKYNYTQYRFTLLAGVDFEINDRFTLHLSGLPLDHRYSYERTHQTSGLIWQAGLSFYP